MINSLTPLIPAFIGNFVDVLRESTPLSAVSTGFGEASVPLGGTVQVPYSAPVSGATITPGATSSDPGGVTVNAATITMNKNRKFAFGLTGDDQLRAASMGADFKSLQMKQAVRALINEVWADVAALHVYASEAFGTAGTTPFSSDLSVLVAARKGLRDSLTSLDGLSLIMDTTAEANLLKLGSLANNYQSGTDETLRQGKPGILYNFNPLVANSVPVSTKGTGTAYVTGSAVAAGAVQIPLITGSGTVVTGDVVTFAGDTTQYVVKTGISAPGTITLNQRTQDGGGLRVALASGAAMTIINKTTRNMAFHQSAIGLAIRPSAVPDGGDAATDRILMTDPVTGLTVAVAMYKQYMQQSFEIQATWGASMIRPELAKLVLG